MSFLKRAWLGKFSLGFTFWIMGCVLPTPIFAGKVYLREAGVFTHPDLPVFLAGQLFLWVEWAYFAFITVALWNAAANHLQRAERGEGGRPIWGQMGRALAVASGLLTVGAFANLSGISELVLGKSMFIGMSGG
jgi:hypothetical protein